MVKRAYRSKLLKYRDWPIAIRLAVIFSLLMAIVISVIGLNSYSLYKSSLERQIEDFMPQLLVQVNKHLDTYQNELISVTQTALLPPYYDYLLDALEEANDPARTDRLKLSLDLIKATDFIKTFRHQHIRGINLYAESGIAFIRLRESGSILRDLPYREQEWFPLIDPFLLSPNMIGTNKQTRIDGEPYVFSVIQPIKRPGNPQAEGLLEVSGSLEVIDNILSDIDFGEGSVLYVVDHNNNIMYSSKNGLLGTPWHNLYALDWNEIDSLSGSHLIAEDGETRLLSYNRSSKTGWKVVASIPMKNLSLGIGTVRYWNNLWILLGIAATVIVSIFVSYSITNSLRLLSRQIKNVDSQDFQTPLVVPFMDEVGQVAQAFRKLMKRIDILVNEVLQTKILKQEAEINALQSQINPHFLNNALETIRFISKNGDLDAAENGLIALGDILRYQAARKQEMVTIRTEMEFITNYLHIQKMRFGPKLNVHSDIEPAVLDLRIPSLIIQPLVENAITHGQNLQDHSIDITIRIRLKGDCIQTAVIDEGKGMSDSRLEEVIAMMESGEAATPRIGLANVSQRVKLMYKGAGEISIRSTEGIGTLVALKLPAWKEGAVRP